jgi:hypothetical protein
MRCLEDAPMSFLEYAYWQLVFHLASILHGLGAVTYLQHRAAVAAAYYKRAVEIRKKLLKLDDRNWFPHFAAWRRPCATKEIA